MSGSRFVTAINCIDGRVQMPIIEWMKREYHADYVDMITEPGPNRMLAENPSDPDVISIKRRVGISVMKHASKVVAVIGHHDCAGNPVHRETQIKQIKAAVETINSWGLHVQVIGLWIDDQWAVHKIV
ncbi:MAG: hypothetical protein NT130_03605 [Candidatus Micrarchaeota archaeon]|nr:hypothetical protein [Candidatus Micrarchaeota archaeon]